MSMEQLKKILEDLPEEKLNLIAPFLSTILEPRERMSKTEPNLLKTYREKPVHEIDR